MYKAKFGAYSITSEDGFSSEAEAVKYILERYPELEEDDLKGKLDSLIIKGDADKSGNISEKNSESAESGSQFDRERSNNSEIRKSKSR